MKDLSEQRGAAIIVALFVMSLVVIASVTMMTRLRIDVRNTELLKNSIQGYHYAQGSIAWAMEQLNNNWKQKKPEQIVDRTPIQSPVNEVDGAEIKSIIDDAEGRFNINNLTNPSYIDNFSSLVNIVKPDIGEEATHSIALAVVDWITPGSKNAELDDYYYKSNPPYRSSHRMMVSVSELRLIKGITQDLYMALLPHVIALPEVTKININNATIPVLMCLSKTLSITSAKAIIAKRTENPFVSIPSFLALDIIKNNPIPEDKITTLSSYFLVKTDVKVGKQDIMLYTLLQRIEKNALPYEVIIWQSKGTL